MEKRIVVYGCSAVYGGTESYLLTLYDGIDRSKLQFDFLFNYDIGDIPYAYEIEKRGGRIYREYYKNSEKNVCGAITVDELFKKHPEWSGVYVNWQSIDTAYRLIISAKRCGLPYRVVHAHNNNYNRHFGWKDKLYEQYFHFTKRKNVTNYFACSDLAGQWLFRGEPYMVVPNAVDFQKFAFNTTVRSRIRKQLELDENAKIIGFCGRLVPQKNPIFLLDVFNIVHKKSPNTYLLILGDGKLRESVEKKVASYGLEKSVILVGAVTNVEDYMQAMDCFILPSCFEGFGIVLLEAQAAGLKCFTSKRVVPEATNLTGHVSFLDLEAGAEYWANKILTADIERYDAMSELLDSEYTVKKASQILMHAFDC